MNAELLEKIGLTRNESLVYMSLLQLGTSKTGEILKKSKLNSGKIYEILESLKAKGLVSESVINNIRHFTAAPPKQLIDYLEKRKKAIDNEEKLIKSMIPGLEKLRKVSIGKAKSVTYTGFRGFKTAVEEGEAGLKKGDEVLAMGVTEKKEKRFNDFWINQFHKRRKAKKIYSKTIVSEKSYYYDELSGPYTECRIIPMVTPAAVTIFGKGKTLLLNYKEPYTFTLIYDEEITTSFRNFFYQLWEQDFHLYKGEKEIKKMFNNIADELNPGEEWLVMGASKFSSKFNKFFTELAKKMKAKSLNTKLLFDEDMKEQIEIFKSMGQEVKIVSREYATPAEINVYKNKVLTVLYSKEPRGWIIENKEMADSYRKFFYMLWNQDTKTFKGVKAGVSAFKRMVDLMKKDDEWIGYVINPEQTPDYFEEINKLHKLRAEKGLKSRLIFYEKSKKFAFNRKKIKNTKIKYANYETPTVVNVAGDITILNIPSKKETTVFYIENKDVADSFRQRFERIWKTAKK